ncbi:hypothetical protein JZ751_012044 [Albula glossodonta]|uniref:Secreted protein n=1 Tax=Albula glossodonta TaxID=121402 RepID=A0A8T2PRD3_9TELE|nr:hypothetical protein JZ751_012044 [Albula glossodonta]
MIRLTVAVSLAEALLTATGEAVAVRSPLAGREEESEELRGAAEPAGVPRVHDTDIRPLLDPGTSDARSCARVGPAGGR